MKKVNVMITIWLVLVAGVAFGDLLNNDGGFEEWNSSTDLTKWKEKDDSGGSYPLVVQQETSIKTQGDYSAYTEFGAGSHGSTYIFGNSRGHFVNPSETYVFELDFYPTEENKSIYAQLWQYNSSGSPVGHPYDIGGGISNETPNEWHTLSFEFGEGTDKPLNENTAYVLAKIWCGNWATWKGYIDNARITLIPEPAMIGLLMLGGVFLRRRK